MPENIPTKNLVEEICEEFLRLLEDDKNLDSSVVLGIKTAYSSQELNSLNKISEVFDTKEAGS